MVKFSEIQAKAKLLGVQNPSSNKTELIKQIQTAEGFQACYKTKTKCEIMNCCWRDDCIKK